MWLNAQTPEVLNLKKLIEPPYNTDVGLLHSSIHVRKLSQTGRQVLQEKNSYNCVKTDAQRSTTGWSSTQNNIKIANHVVHCKWGFWMAEEQKKRNTFFSHVAGSVGSSVRGVFRSYGISKFSCFCSLPPLYDLSAYPPFRCFLDCCRISSNALVLHGYSFILHDLYVLGSVSC